MDKQLHTVLSYVRPESLPPGWKLVSVGHVLSGAQYGMNIPAVPDGQTPIVGMKDIQGGRVLFDNLAKTNVSDVELVSYRLRKGDVLINRTNSLDQVGKVGLVEKDENAVFASYLVRLLVDETQIESEYLAYWLNCNIAQRTIKRIATPAIGQANLNPTEFQKYCLIPLPPKAQRLRIVEILRTWDKAIEKTSELIAAKELQLKWFRSQLLTGKGRLSRHGGEWLSARLSELLVEHGEKSAGDEEVFSVSVHKGLVNQIEHLGRSFAAKTTAHYNRVKHGDIVYTKSPTGDFPLGIIKRSKIVKDVIVSPLYGVFTPTDPRIGIILDAFFDSPINTKNYLAPLVQKGAKNTIAITNKRFLEGRVRVPADAAERSALAELVTTARREIDTLREEVDMRRRQKCGLMQKLLTGEWLPSIRDHESSKPQALSIAESVQ